MEESAKEFGFGSFLLGIVPSSAVGAFADGDVLPVLFFSVIFAFALSAIALTAGSMSAYAQTAEGSLYGKGKPGSQVTVSNPDTGASRSVDPLSGGETFMASMALALGLVLRIIIVNALPGSGFGVDLDAFRYWAANLAAEGPFGFYERGFFADYTPGYLYLLWLVGAIGGLVGWIGDLIKVPAILADGLVFGAVLWTFRQVLAADYLVMAAWLTYFKSRLVLPQPEGPAIETYSPLVISRWMPESAWVSTSSVRKTFARASILIRGTSFIEGNG